ncbi:MAG: hypothetical protein AB7P40_23500 [Chloroflexota bacterium]
MDEDRASPPGGGSQQIEEMILHTHGVVTSRTLEPAVQLTFGDRKPITLAAAEALRLAHDVVEAAVSAEQDALFLRYLTREGGFRLPEAGAVLLALRRFRAISDEGSQQ